MDFKSMKLGTKLGLMFGTLTLLIVFLGLSGSYSLMKIADQWTEYETVINVREGITADAIQGLGNAVHNFKDYLLRGQDYDKKVKAELDGLQRGIDAYRKTGQISDAEDGLLKELAVGVQGYRGAMVKVVEMKTGGSAVAEIDAAIKGMDRPIENALLGLKKINAEATHTKGIGINSEISTAKTVAASLTVIGIVIAILMGALFTRNLLAQLGGEPTYAAEIAMKISSGDLTRKVVLAEKDSSSVLFVMKAMQDSLIKVVSEVRSSANGVATGSTEIAEGNADLSARTETQAGSVEETASSMEEITATTEKSAEHASEANKLTQAAAKVAEKGGHVVGDVVKTMQGINNSSQKIADIISVIDGIAFQTNILALNAAVEAARAGEQGRGFAVVASEVRNLAQRSALAAKEIKELITDSVSRVSEGTRLVDEAGVTMNSLLGEIQHVTDIVGEISDSSREQNSGMRQINQAVILMDQTTQQNAAMVEQMAAAAESLQEQAQHLLDAVAVFKLPNDASSRQQAQNVIQVSKKTAASIHSATKKPMKLAHSGAAPVRKVVNTAAEDQKDWEEF